MNPGTRVAVAWLVALTSCTRAESTLGDATPSSTTTGGLAPASSVSVAREACVPGGGDIAEGALRRHLENFAQIAKQHAGNRSRASGGFDASVAYVMRELESLGLAPELRGFDVASFTVVGPGVLEVTSPRARAFLPGRNRLRTGDFTPLSGSPPGDARGQLVGVGIELGHANVSASGCTLTDFADAAGKSVVAGRIALLQRGTCPFVTKVQNAEAAGARAAVVFNQGDSALRRGLERGGLDGRGVDHGITIPALFITTRAGEELWVASRREPLEVHVATDTAPRLDRVHNVVLDLAGTSDDGWLAVGAHLDSVENGPGLNDNASGAAVLLELARAMATCAPRRGVRLAWWGAEEEGLLGSTAYVAGLSSAQIGAVRGYINLDMVAAPNHAFMLTDGDGSRFPPSGPGGSGELEAFFRRDFEELGVPLLEVEPMARSDDKPFLEAGIATVMLGAGYDGVKDARQAKLFGGTVGKRFDDCYHRACDDIGNINWEALVVIAHAVERAVEHFAWAGQGL